MRLLCPAKINLHLRVGRRRADGFHPLLSWMTTVGLFDTLTVETLPPPAGAGGAPAGGEWPRAATPAGRGPARHEEPPPGRERAGEAEILRLSSDLPGLPVDGTNLVVRAAETLAA